MLKLRYISYGGVRAGGFRFELFFAEKLRDYLITKGKDSKLEVCRKDKLFSKFLNVSPFLWAFKNAVADINVLAIRTAIPAILKNYFSSRKLLIILHNYDPADGKSALLEKYYKFLFFLLKKKNKNIAIVTGAMYWKNHFQQRMPAVKIFFFPNMFDIAYLKKFKTTEKKKQIHLGQWSVKNSADIFSLAKSLSEKGYQCYFSSLVPIENASEKYYRIIHFSDQEDYLKEMASSLYTIAFTAVNEGWNRVSHESVIVGTPVIGYAKAGLGNLIEESSSFGVNSVKEALKIIDESRKTETRKEFVEKYDQSNAFLYLKPIVDFIGL